MRVSEQTKQQNRSRILEKGAELFISKGFEATTTRDIAIAAGLAAGTMFNYFSTKETMAMTMVNEALRQATADYRQRRTGDESLTEDLFLFIASGLRRLQPLRTFLSPVFERSLSPFPRKNVCQEGETARQEHLQIVLGIISCHGFTEAPHDASLNIYWSLYLGILAFWLNDASSNQEESRALIDYTLHFFVRTISGGEQTEGGYGS